MNRNETINGEEKENQDKNKEKVENKNIPIMKKAEPKQNADQSQYDQHNKKKLLIMIILKMNFKKTEFNKTANTKQIY